VSDPVSWKISCIIDEIIIHNQMLVDMIGHSDAGLMKMKEAKNPDFSGAPPSSWQTSGSR
jgi:hypothetical protein